MCIHTTFDSVWQRCIRCLKLYISFCKRATNYRAFLRKMTCKDKASYASSPPCSCMCTPFHRKLAHLLLQRMQCFLLFSTLRLLLDWFWKSGWLIHKSALCTRIALIPQWGPNSHKCLQRLHELTISTKNRVSKSVYLTDWFWKSGWLIHKSALCTRIALLPQWGPNSHKCL